MIFKSIDVLRSQEQNDVQFENDLKISNALEEIEIMKATTSDHMLNIMQNNNPLY